MAFSRNVLERLHNDGLMPDWDYYSQVDMEPWEKLQAQRDKFLQDIQEHQAQERQEAELEAKVYEMV